MNIRTDREKIEETIQAIVGKGRVSVSGTPGSTYIHVQRASFNDNDLKAILELTDQLDDVNAPITFLDLSATSITERGASSLSELNSLERYDLPQKVNQ